MACLSAGKRFCFRDAKPIFLQTRFRSFIRKKMVTREESLRMSRTSEADYQSILRRLNLSEQWPNFQGTSAEIQLLSNESNRLHYMYIRPGNSFPTYYRIELIMQRLRYMSSMGLTAKDKLIGLMKQPPVLIVGKKQIFDGSEMVYLRGIVKGGSDQKYVFHPAFPRMNVRKNKLDERLDDLGNQMETTRQKVLEIAMSLPCFSLRREWYEKHACNVICLHKMTLPQFYDVDAHTFKIYPPISKFTPPMLKNLQSRSNIPEKIPELCEYGLKDLLDTTYNIHNGRGCPEDFTEFVLRSYKEECHYNPPVNFKKKPIPRKHRRFYMYSPLPEWIAL